jgi:cytosine/adenosine deaminase-related metal-dependent hydrolase
MKIT